jgi:hypothetical protein
MIRYRSSYAETEAQPGLAVFASGDVMRDWLATSRPGPAIPEADRLAKGPRYFVVIARRGPTVWIVPMFSEARWYREPLADKLGHPKWTTGSTCYDPSQVWSVPVALLVIAANRAGDLSGRLDRNRVGARGLSELRATVRGRLAA